VTFTTAGPYTLGQSYGGGIIVYIDETGQHGLIKGTTQGVAEWGCRGQFGISTSSAAGTGESNTQNIVNGCAARPIAASLCYDSTLNGYSDWYLPSQGDVQLAFNNGFDMNTWTSTAVSANEGIWARSLGMETIQKYAERDAIPFRNF
jgi:hypothetical protein